MPSMSDTTRIAASGSQPPFCSWARHNSGMIADCWRPAGYFAICSFAHAAFSAVKENSFGCWSGGARRRLAMVDYSGSIGVNDGLRRDRPDPFFPERAVGGDDVVAVCGAGLDAVEHRQIADRFIPAA